MRKPPITITCDCGTSASIAYGESWRCGECGKTWNTAQIPHDEYLAMLRGVRRYRFLVLGPPLVLAAIMIPLAVLVNVSYAFLLFVCLMGYALLVVPPLRRRASIHVMTNAPTWTLRPE